MICEATCSEDRHHQLPLHWARTKQPGAGKSNGNGHGDSDHALARGLQEVVRTALKEVLPDAVEKAMASGGKTRADRATDQAPKKEREAREPIFKHEATIASLRAQLVALEDGLEAAEDAAREPQAGKVKAESLLEEKAAECDRALSILNRTYGQNRSPSK